MNQARPDQPIGAGELPPGYPFKPEWEVTPREVASGMRSENNARPLLLDCREPDEFAFCRIDGATLLPLGELERRADELEDDEGRRDRPIVVYCHHGRRSLRAAALLRALGFTDVRSMAGGIDLWSQRVDDQVPRY